MLEAWRSDNDRFLERAVESINKQLERCKFAMSKSKTFVETIESAPKWFEPVV
jgi:hypothetical protein